MKKMNHGLVFTLKEKRDQIYNALYINFITDFVHFNYMAILKKFQRRAEQIIDLCTDDEIHNLWHNYLSIQIKNCTLFEKDRDNRTLIEIIKQYLNTNPKFAIKIEKFLYINSSLFKLKKDRDIERMNNMKENFDLYRLYSTQKMVNRYIDRLWGTKERNFTDLYKKFKYDTLNKIECLEQQRSI